MVFTGSKFERHFSRDLAAWVLLLLVTVHSTCNPLANGQQVTVGVSLKVQGLITSNNSLVDIDDVIRFGAENVGGTPTNTNELHESALLCVTDLEDCCDTPRTVRGEWYYPNGNIVDFDLGGRQVRFRRNRGPNEFFNGRQFYGSVRLFRRWSPTERGRFRCELPSADNSSINQTIYANIVDFDPSIKPVTISPSGSSTAGEIYSLMCSTTLRTNPLPINVPSPTFQWFFGPNGNALLPSGVTPMATVLGTNNTYFSSTLQFSRLSQSHAGMYTCRLGAGRLVADITIPVNDPPISVFVASTTNLSKPLMVGQTGNTLTCVVSGADSLDPVITYRWTRNDGTTQIQVRTKSISETISISPLRLSYAGVYICSVNISSTLLRNNISLSAGNDTESVIIQIPDPQSVVVNSSLGNIVRKGSSVTLICTVELGPAVTESELSLLMVDAQLSRDGTPLALTGPIVNGTTFTYTAQLNMFGRSDSGNYTCTATVRAQSDFSAFLIGISQLSDTIRVTTGVYFSLRDKLYNNNSNIRITDVGVGECGALLCFTDLVQCCNDSDTPIGVGALGQWLYPNGSAVGVKSDGQDFYIDRGPSVVRLNRKNSVTPTSGQFCCVIPDATLMNITICMAPPSEQTSMISTCSSEVSMGVAVAVVATILIECLLAAPITAAVLALCWKRRTSCNKNTNAVEQREEFEDNNNIMLYEDPDKMVASTATTAFKVSVNTNSNLQPPAAEDQSSYYEL